MLSEYPLESAVSVVSISLVVSTSEVISFLQNMKVIVI